MQLTFHDVTAGYRGAAVVHGLSLTLQEGCKVGLIGRNGSGKTTTLATAMGLVQLQRGQIEIDGQDVAGVPAFERARRGLGYVPQGRGIFPSLTVEENLRSAVRGQSAQDAIDSAYMLFPRLKERARNGGSQLSGGEQQMLSVARALAGQPRLLLLDEPLEGLAPMIRQEVMNAINELNRKRGIGCLLVDQHIDLVLDFVDIVIVLERGVQVLTGSAAELRSSRDILDRTIGLAKT